MSNLNALYLSQTPTGDKNLSDPIVDPIIKETTSVRLSRVLDLRQNPPIIYIVLSPLIFCLFFIFGKIPQLFVSSALDSSA